MPTALFFTFGIYKYITVVNKLFHVVKRLFHIEYGVVPLKKSFQNSNWINGDGREREQRITAIGTTLPEASRASQELVKGSCKKTCNTSCKCKKFELPCIELCMCSGGCWMSNWTKIFGNAVCYWNRELDLTSRCLLLF